MVRSVPRELSSDQAVALESAQIAGYISQSMLSLNFKWDNTRAGSVLDDLLGAGILWVDAQAREPEYWLPSSIQNMT